MKKRGASKRQFYLWQKQELTSAEYSAAYRERTPDKAKAAQKKYRDSHKEELRQRRYDKYHKDLKASRKANRDKQIRYRSKVQGGFHRYHLNRYYGAGAADYYAAQMEKQQGKCAACDCVPKGKLHLDHNHETRQFRGLLCGECNRALGLCKESVGRLRKLAAYLEQWGVAAAA